MNKKELKSYKDSLYWSDAAISFLQEMIAIPSLSKNEDKVADHIQSEIESYGIPTLRVKNNVIAFNKTFSAESPSIILNSHHDTVPPNTNYSKNPYLPTIEDGKIYGLGSNDAGGCLSSLIHCFIALYGENHEL
jgi:acetylornithine deacetylase